MRGLGIFAFRLGLILTHISKVFSNSPPITASIQAKWKEPPLLIQILEAATLERPGNFFELLDVVLASWTGNLAKSATDEQIYQHVTKALRKSGLFDEPGEFESLEASIALKEAHPKLEALRAWSESNLQVESREEVISEQKVFGSNSCDSWVEVEGKKVCDSEGLEELLNSDSSQNIFSDYTVFPFDHMQGSLSREAKTAILYASDDPQTFDLFHKILLKAVRSSPQKVKYVFRWHLTIRSPSDHEFARLSGWAAGLDIKKSEYLTLDDRPVDLTSENEASGNFKKGNSKPESINLKHENTKLKSLKATEISDIGLKAAQHVLSSEKPLSALRELTENFPKHAHSLVTDWVPGSIDVELKDELELNLEEGYKPGRSSVWINGLEISFGQSENLNFFQLIEVMRNERRWISTLNTLGLSPLDSRRLITNDDINAAMNPTAAVKLNGGMLDPSVLGERFDASDRQEGGGAILWLNDLEKDSRYSDWPSNLRYLLRPTYPGQLHPIARNLITVVIAANLTNIESLTPLAEIVEPIISHGLPIRWGLVPLLDDENSVSESITRTFWNLFQAIGTADSLNFIKKFVESSESKILDSEKFSYEASKAIAEARQLSDSDEEKVEDFVEEKFKTWLSKAQKYASRLELCSSDKSVSTCVLINGRFFILDDDFRSNLQQTATVHTQFLQHQIYFNHIDNEADVANYLYDLSNVNPSRNEFVFPSEEHPLKFANMVEALKSSRSIPAQIFFENAEQPKLKSGSPSKAVIWIVGNLDSGPGIAAVSAGLALVMRPPPELSVQAAFVHVPNTDSSNEITGVSKILEALMGSKSESKISSEDILKLRRLGLLANYHESTDLEDSVDDTSIKIVKPRLVTLDNDTSESIWSTSAHFLQILGLKRTELAVVINGRVLTVSPKRELDEADIRTLVEFETKKRTAPCMKALNEINLKVLERLKPRLPLLVSVLGSVLVEAEEPMQTSLSKPRSIAYSSRIGNHSSFTLGDKKSVFEIGVILDPASETAQKWSAFLEILSKRSDVFIKVWLNPVHNSKELPIKRFFRTVFANSLEFDEAGGIIAPDACFRDVPSDVLLTLGIEAPPSWLVLPKVSVHDLDNIMLSELPEQYREKGVDAVMQLEHIIISGHSREAPHGRPPRGLQLVLTDLLRGGEVDTIIMANLGYFQFKSAPGLHRISIRPGRSSELYALESLEAAEKNALIASPNSTRYNGQICLTTYNGVKLFPRFEKLPGKENENLIQPLDADSRSSNNGAGSDIAKLMGHFKEMASGILRKTDLTIKVNPELVINIFTVASGLLYERMAYLMCVSVMRHTKSKVKFWFISNFLSPSFKRFIPHLAQEYGFDYQLVTYQWPPWLRAQKEKQRVIWGYKILFLDVLFPLELERVIFVDSDQIVRTDLKTLVELDLQGAPYAYTPMCNDRNETKGFRFWDTGYWKDSLQGKPYHISALYVVDLRVFRTVAAGDQLRQHYQALSADPGSLANLDQDLPNNMQNVLPIFSLDQSWLWCETWCSDEGLKTAKTIDLCNNPLTHEPKLARARRLIPEWDIYDKEVAKLALRVKKETEDENETPINMQVGDDVSVESQSSSIEDAEHKKDEL
ncbi:UDP-glucose:glycoprotein glucosyltransferase-domain-containing protein [Phakopsora pachyrhizi]|uniref:UDP-glucose:Glyco protein glucosyltransferase-domain-containing protein n=1 Tax=Phakopsora pachyrhizi TaxID=170000 RepID=A0AAV0AUT7_PHAPC|nr:UDP-glucose:glycoprotein glucosyltransferase-domain-containing protein [Phakopsora pachyrhizi]CAH7673649.1 UDP-glucose:Glyco protein glucosyltransferase-domain-containing protein [Phakopsora pachyrhizi]